MTFNHVESTVQIGDALLLPGKVMRVVRLMEDDKLGQQQISLGQKIR